MCPMKKSFRLEGTENMTDEFISKKHQKHENEEIKIKRWDMRMQKEEYERNRRNLAASGSKATTSKLAKSVDKSSLNNTVISFHSKKSTNKAPTGSHGIYCRKFVDSLLDGNNTNTYSTNN
jgi:hypothetical protein